MQESDTDDAFACTDVLGRAGAGLRVDLNVLIEIDKILDAFVMSVLLDHCVDNQLGCTGSIIVGQPDESLVLRIEQIFPVLRSFQTFALQFILVDHEAQDSLVDAIPVAVFVTVCITDQMRSILCRICL